MASIKMAKCNFHFLTVFIVFLGGIQVGLSVPQPTGTNNNEHLIKMFDIDVLLNRLDQMEAKVAEHENMVSLVNQHELKINRQQEEIDQLKKKNEESVEEKNDQLVQIGNGVTSRDSLPRSCFEIKATNPNAQSGVYVIDPNGQIGGDPSIQVYCDMATRTTSISHDTEGSTNIPGCPDPGCYTKEITYSATMRQILNLAEISASCRQRFRYDSLGVPLEYNNTQYSYWNDRNGGKQIFWAGPATTEHTCQCGIDNNCIERSYKCNSDCLAPIDLFDDGYITATELLPVKRLNFGRTNLLGVKASYTLGRFECSGQATISSKPSNCLDLFKIGHTLSGFYDVKGSSTQIASTYCDFTKSSTETGYETRYGFVDVKTSPVHFFVTRTSDWDTVGTMTFEFGKEYLNLGGGMNMTSGVFTAPKAGTYTFSFKTLAYYGRHEIDSQNDYSGMGWLYLQRNGVDVAVGHSYIGGPDPTYSTKATLTVHGTLKLNQGDTVNIRFYAGGTFSNKDSNTLFTGSLLEEDLVIS